MELHTLEDSLTSLPTMYEQLNTVHFDTASLRYLGQHWKKEISLPHLQDVLKQIESTSWKDIEKKRLIFVLTITFPHTAVHTAQHWVGTLTTIIASLQSLPQEDREHLLEALSTCHLWTPSPALPQVQTLIDQCIELKRFYPNKNFNTQIITPIFACVKHNGLMLFEAINLRAQRQFTTHATESKHPPVTQQILSFSEELSAIREALEKQFSQEESQRLITLFVTLESHQDISLDTLAKAFLALKNKSNKPTYVIALLNTLSHLNMTKSHPLPTTQTIYTLCQALEDKTGDMPDNVLGTQGEETWFQEYFHSKELLSGCVFGDGSITKLNDLIIDGLAASIDKFAGLLDMQRVIHNLDKALTLLVTTSKLRFIPGFTWTVNALKEQLQVNFIPLLRAFDSLIQALRQPNPSFDIIYDNLQAFETIKPKLLTETFGLIGLGSASGKAVLSLILTGEINENEPCSDRFKWTLAAFHGAIKERLSHFLTNYPIPGITKDIILGWFTEFNTTHSLVFLFKEELVQQIVSSIKKTLVQLDTKDPAFEESIENQVRNLPDIENSANALMQYKNNIEAWVGLPECLNE